eukprot:gene13163-9009_t
MFAPKGLLAVLESNVFIELSLYLLVVIFGIVYLEIVLLFSAATHFVDLLCLRIYWKLVFVLSADLLQDSGFECIYWRVVTCVVYGYYYYLLQLFALSVCIKYISLKCHRNSLIVSYDVIVITLCLYSVFGLHVYLLVRVLKVWCFNYLYLYGDLIVSWLYCTYLCFRTLILCLIGRCGFTLLLEELQVVLLYSELAWYNIVVFSLVTVANVFTGIVHGFVALYIYGFCCVTIMVGLTRVTVSLQCLYAHFIIVAGLHDNC